MARFDNPQLIPRKKLVTMFLGIPKAMHPVKSGVQPPSYT